MTPRSFPGVSKLVLRVCTLFIGDTGLHVSEKHSDKNFLSDERLIKVLSMHSTIAKKADVPLKLRTSQNKNNFLVTRKYFFFQDMLLFGDHFLKSWKRD